MQIRFSSLLPLLLALAPASVLAAACGNGKTVIVGVPSLTCPEGLERCEEGFCADLESDPQHCGACSIVCMGGYCSEGHCMAGCPPDLVDCGGSCVDIGSHPHHCGGCGVTCSLDAVCASGTCQTEECLCDICEFVELSSTVPQTFFDTTLGKGDQVEPLCAGANGADVTFVFTAPYDGVFWFDTFGTGFDTALQVTSAACEELGCNDEYAVNGTSAVTVELPAGHQVFVTIDAFFAGGDVQLNIHDDNGPCDTCAAAIEDVTPHGPVCPGSEDLYLSLRDCRCDGACAAPCKDLCNGGSATQACTDCTMSDAGCGKQVNDCASDI